ncbi:MAG: hypothetical protein HY017_12415 [Betaproteobacteria bacterium]|nr:hypothetical protein [Betaproteobacteria bacterium]
MIFEILRRTPAWVFPLFFLLLYLGYAQSRTRSVTPARLAILPVAMPVLSLAGLLSVFGASAVALACWSAAPLAAAWSVAAAGIPRGVLIAPATGAFIVPGSWWPLSLIMVIFFTRYAVAVALARDASLSGLALFAMLVSTAYGLSSGYFVGRAVHIWRGARPAGAAA